MSLDRRSTGRAWALAAALALGAPRALALDSAPGAAPAGMGFLGVTTEATENGHGVRVVAVVPDSPAERSGLQPGDLIETVEGQVPATPAAFSSRVRGLGVGGSAHLVIERGGARMTFTVALGTPPPMGAAVRLGPGTTPPPLRAQVVMGQGPGDLAQLRGRVVLLDFWASWCGPCRMVMPLLNQMHQRFNAQGLTVLGVTEENASTARSVGTQLSIGYTLVSDASANMRFGVSALPTLVLIDRRGVVRRVSVGVDGAEVQNVERLVRQLLAERP